MKILCVIGKSASGKSTLIKDIKNKYGDTIHIVKSYTTRAVRENDVDDINTHTFVDNKFWEDNKGKSIAVYNSPKGYKSWTDINSFKEDCWNLYAIDPIALNEELYPSVKDLGWDIKVIYITLDEEVRKNRYLRREGTLEGFSEEYHLDIKHMRDIPEVTVLNSIIGTKELIGRINLK